MKRLCIILIACLVCSSCAALKVERTVTADNVFYSSFPKFKIKFDPEFVYIDIVDKFGMHDDVKGNYLALSASIKWYTFIEAKDRIVKRLVGVNIQETSGRYITDFWRTVKNPIEKGKQQLNDKEYRYFTRAVSGTGGHLVDYLNKKGFKVPRGLFKMSGRIMGGKGNILVSVVYYESLEDSDTEYKPWLQKITLTEKHLAHLKEFNKRFMSSFEIIE